MSRRTRMKSRKNQDHFGFGTSHHDDYASSISYFPKSYSPLGRQIKFPSTAVPFLSEGKLTFYGNIQSFQQKFNQLQENDILQIHTVNIGIRGKISQKMSQFNNCIFAFSMILCCVSQLFKTSFYRDRFFTKYQFDMNNYKKLINIFKSIPRLETVIMTFQDNSMSKEKLTYLDQSFSLMGLKSLTLRNLTYFITPTQKISIGIQKVEQFERIKKSKMEFIFVWQRVNVHYNSKDLQEQKQSIAASLCDEL